MRTPATESAATKIKIERFNKGLHKKMNPVIDERFANTYPEDPQQTTSKQHSDDDENKAASPTMILLTWYNLSIGDHLPLQSSGLWIDRSNGDGFSTDMASTDHKFTRIRQNTAHFPKNNNTWDKRRHSVDVYHAYAARANVIYCWSGNDKFIVSFIPTSSKPITSHVTSCSWCENA